MKTEFTREGNTSQKNGKDPWHGAEVFEDSDRQKLNNAEKDSSLELKSSTARLYSMLLTMHAMLFNSEECV